MRDQISRETSKQSPFADQVPQRWNGHVDLYQAVFEPLTDQFAAEALATLAPPGGRRLIDCAAGAGGAALAAARAGFRVTAVDAAPAMVARVASRAAGEQLRIEAACMDAQALAFADRRFAAALSVFGVILCPDPVAALRESARVTERGGRIAIVTWTEPERYELAARLMRAGEQVGGGRRAPSRLPPQLRFCERDAFRQLFAEAGLEVASMKRLEGRLRAPSTNWLAERLAFAPGLADMLDGFGPDRGTVVARFASNLRRDKGEGAIDLSAVALLGVATRP